MPGIIGKKIGWYLRCQGKALPCTIIEAGPCVVTSENVEKMVIKLPSLGMVTVKKKHPKLSEGTIFNKNL